MDILKLKWKKNLLSRTWQRCTRLTHIRKFTSGSSNQVLSKSKSWNSGDPTTHYAAAARPQTTPSKGCFSVYVGPNRQRFFIKAEFANHPLFRMLLDDAESEYGGYKSDGPISLPCDVELFYKVLADVEFYSQFDEDRYDVAPSVGLGCGGFIMSPLARRRSFPTLGGGDASGGYNLLSPSRSSLLKLNNAAAW